LSEVEERSTNRLNDLEVHFRSCQGGIV